MRIGIIGTGRVGSALKSGWTASGLQVQIAGRKTVPGIADVSAWADVIVLAIPYAALKDVTPQIAPAQGKIVIDCTNPVSMGPDGLAVSVGHSTSGGETVQAALPNTRVVKTLNQVGAEIMADVSGFAHPPVQFMASQSDTAKTQVAELLRTLGFEPLDAGNLSASRLLEPFALLWITQATAGNKGRDWAFGAMPRGTST